MPIDAFLELLRSHPEQLEFETTLAVIDELYEFEPVAFRNGAHENAAGENTGSCRVFAFASLLNLTEQETLACFGRHYREDVLQHPDAQTHPNIRNFMKTGWSGIAFDGEALTPRSVRK